MKDTTEASVRMPGSFAPFMCLALACATAAVDAQEEPEASPTEETAPAPAEQEATTEPEAPPAEDAEAAPAPQPAQQTPREVQTIPVEVEDKDATRLEDILVTSSKRVKAQRDIPGTVGVVSGDYLEKIKAQSLADYLKLQPGVAFVEYAPDRNIPIIRGISTSTSFGFTQLPTGIFVDDMPFSDLFVGYTSPNLNPFDLERVEILKGPQGTLFGSGALAGAIRYVTKKPDLGVWGAKVSGTYAKSSQGGLSPVGAGALNIPLFGDDAALRIMGITRHDQGGIYDLTKNEDNVDETDQYNARMLGTWNATDNLKVDGLVFIQKTYQPDLIYTDNSRRFDRSNAPRSKSPVEGGIGGGNIQLSYDFSWATLLSSSNVLTKDYYGRFYGAQAFEDPGEDPGQEGEGDNDVGTEDVGGEIYTQLSSDTRGWVQEFRLMSPEGGDDKIFGTDWLGLEWLAGVVYQRNYQYILQYSPAPSGTSASGGSDAVRPVDTAPGFPLTLPTGQVIHGSRDTTISDFINDSVADESALFGEATAALGDHWEVTAGGRLFKTELTNNAYFAGVQVSILQPGSTEYYYNNTTEATGFNPKFSARYKFNKEIQTYALAAKGFQFGGVQFNPPLAGLQAGEQGGFKPYKSSSLWNYEWGLRTEFFDRLLRFDVTLFYMDWKDLQINVPKPLLPGSTVTYTVTENIGRAVSKGVEVPLQIGPFKGLTFTSSAAWVNAKTVEDFQSAEGFIPAGSRLPGSPRFQMANVLSYARPLTFFGNWESGVNLTHAHTGSSFNTLRRFREIGGYDTLDLNFSLVKPDWMFAPELTLQVTNLTDVRGIVNAFGTEETIYNTYYLVQPRTALASLVLKF